MVVIVFRLARGKTSLSFCHLGDQTMMISAWFYSSVAVIGNFRGPIFKFLDNEIWNQASFAFFFSPCAEVTEGSSSWYFFNNSPVRWYIFSYGFLCNFIFLYGLFIFWKLLFFPKDRTSEILAWWTVSLLAWALPSSFSACFCCFDCAGVTPCTAVCTHEWICVKMAPPPKFLINFF